MSDQVDINDDVTYTMDTITLYKEETGETYQQEISFVTAGNDASCGVMLEIGEEYLLGLYRTTADPLLMEIGDQLAVGLCGLARVWSSVSDEEKAELDRGCNIDACDGTCSDSQVCRQYERDGKWYCSDSCKNKPCGEGKTCVNRKRKWCRKSGYSGCPKKRRCR